MLQFKYSFIGRSIDEFGTIYSTRYYARFSETFANDLRQARAMFEFLKANESLAFMFIHPAIVDEDSFIPEVTFKDFAERTLFLTPDPKLLVTCKLMFSDLMGKTHVATEHKDGKALWQTPGLEALTKN